LPNIPGTWPYPLGGDTDRGETQMIDFPNLTSPVLWRAGVFVSLAWAIGGALDGGTVPELIAVPMLVAAWISAVVFVDRWVREGVDQE
jgi:hypothetical protein